LIDVVIPVYKLDFLHETLDSLVSQTRKDFKVILGFDGKHLADNNIVAEFIPKLNLDVNYFHENIGKAYPSRNWLRTIDISDSNWIWLFSDDDLAQENCIEELYNTLSRNPSAQLFKFNTVRFNNSPLESKVESPRFNSLTAEELLIYKLSGKIQSYACEYVFKREAFYSLGKFKEFPLSWCTDDATWFNFASHHNLVLINTATVFWRYSGLNISSNTSHIANQAKIIAVQEFLNWIVEHRAYYSFKRKNQVNRLLIKWSYLQIFVYGHEIRDAFRHKLILKKLFPKRRIFIFYYSIVLLTYYARKFVGFNDRN